MSEGEQPLRRALPFILLAGLCFSTLDATAKYLVQFHSLFLVVWARYAGQMLVTAASKVTGVVTTDRSIASSPRLAAAQST